MSHPTSPLLLCRDVGEVAIAPLTLTPLLIKLVSAMPQGPSWELGMYELPDRVAAEPARIPYLILVVARQGELALPVFAMPAGLSAEDDPGLLQLVALLGALTRPLTGEATRPAHIECADACFVEAIARTMGQVEVSVSHGPCARLCELARAFDVQRLSGGWQPH